MKPKKNTNKSIFVSSTFRDMQSERDALRDQVLPRVNEFASQYGRAVELIDLRWGVDTSAISEKEQNCKVLRTCLDEIERSRPFFIGLIGDRYGWTPPSEEMESALSESSIPDIDCNMSVTALEIEYGVLRSKDPPVCLFYFRESPDYAAFTQEQCSIYKDGAEGLSKLEKIKKEIKSRFGADTKSYKAEYKDNELNVSVEWAEMVASDIIDKLRLEWGEPTFLMKTWQEQEWDRQETFRESRTTHFAGRKEAIVDLVEFCLGVDSTPQLLMIQGEAGSGKSGLLCKVMDEIAESCLLLPFTCGISSRSSTAEGMLRYFIYLISKRLGLYDDVEMLADFQEVKDRFIELLNIASSKIRVVAVVDALDQLSGGNESRRMMWISGQLPENFRMLSSIIDGQEVHSIKHLGGEVRSMPQISKEDEAEIIRGIAARHRKQLSDAVVEHILDKRAPDGTNAAQNPLYLSLIAQDLMMMNRYEHGEVQEYMEEGMSQPEALAKFMLQRIDETPGDPEGAYLAILTRLEKLIGSEFIQGVTGMIAVSRSGLRDSELEGSFKELGMKFDIADFSWLRQLLRVHFSQGDFQQWDYTHQSMRRALNKGDEKKLAALNDAIVEHLKKTSTPDIFIAREVLHHLCLSNRPDIAAEIMVSGISSYEDFFTRGLMDANNGFEHGTSFICAIAENAEDIDYKADGDKAVCIAAVFNTLSTVCLELSLPSVPLLCINNCIKVIEYVYGDNQTKTDTEVLLRMLFMAYMNRGRIFDSLSEYDNAIESYNKSIEIADRLSPESVAASMDELAKVYINRGVAYENLNKFDIALADKNTAVQMAERLFREKRIDVNHLAISYMNRGRTYESLGNITEALEDNGKCVSLLEKSKQEGKFIHESILALAKANISINLARQKLMIKEEQAQETRKAYAADMANALFSSKNKKIGETED